MAIYNAIFASNTKKWEKYKLHDVFMPETKQLQQKNIKTAFVSEADELKEQLKTGFAIHGIADIEELNKVVHLKQLEVDRLSKYKETAQSKLHARKKSLEELQALQLINAKLTLTLDTAVFQKIKEPFNIQEFLNIVQKNKESLDHFHNQDIILICGRKGVGKSTFIRYFLNLDCKNEASSVDSMQAHHIIPYRLNFKKLGGNLDKSFVICELPSTTNEVEIANIIGFSNLVQNCKTIRILMLFNNECVTKQQCGLFESFENLLYILPNLNAEVLSNLTYVINRSQSLEDKNIIYQRLKEINEEKKITKSHVLFNHLMENFDRKVYHNVTNDIVIKSNKKQAASIKDIEDLIIQSNGIEYPHSVFDPDLPEKLKNVVQLQIEKLKVIIRESLKNNDYSLIHKRLMDLKYLTEELNVFYDIKDEYEAMFYDVVSFTNLRLEADTKIINQFLTDEVKLEEKIVKNYYLNMNMLQQESIEIIYRRNITHWLELTCALIKNDFTFYIFNTKKIEYEKVNLIVERLDKIKLIIAFFKEYKFYYHKAIECINHLINKILSITKNSFNQETPDFSELLLALNNINILQGMFESVLNNDQILNNFNQLKNDFIVLLQNASNNYLLFDNLFKLLSQITVENMKFKCLDETEFANIQKCLIQKTFDYFNNIKDRITLNLEVGKNQLNDEKNFKPENIFNNISNFVDLFYIKSIPAMRDLVKPLYVDIRIKLLDFIEQIKIVIMNKLINFETRISEDFCKKLMFYLLSLEDAIWIDKIEKTIRTTLIQDIINGVLSKANELNESIFKLDLCLENIDQNNRLLPNLLLASSLLFELESHIPDLTNIKAKTYSFLYKKINSNLEYIFTQLISIKNDLLVCQDKEIFIKIDIKVFDSYRNFLELVKKLSIPNKEDIHKAILEVNSLLQSIVKQYVIFLNSKMKLAFNKIIDPSAAELKSSVFQSSIKILTNYIRECIDLSELNNIQHPAAIWVELSENCRNNLVNWKKELSNNLNDMFYKMTQQLNCKNFEGLDLSLSIIDTLSEVDYYFKFSDVNHRDLSHKFHREFLDCISKMRSEIELQSTLENPRFWLIDNIMLSLKKIVPKYLNHEDFKSLQNKLTDMVSMKINAILKSLSKLDIEDLNYFKDKFENNIIENLNYIIKISRYLHPYLVIENIQTIFKINLKDYDQNDIFYIKFVKKEIVNSFISHLKKNNSDNNFLNIESKIKSIQFICNELIDLQEYQQEVDNEIIKINKVIDVQLKNIIFKCKLTSLQGRLHELKNYYKSLQEIINNDKISFKVKQRYSNVIIEIENIITHKFKNKLSEIAQIENSQQLEQFRKIELILLYLPHDLRIKLTLDFKYFKEDLLTASLLLDNDDLEKKSTQTSSFNKIQPKLH